MKWRLTWNHRGVRAEMLLEGTAELAKRRAEELADIFRTRVRIAQEPTTSVNVRRGRAGHSRSSSKVRRRPKGAAPKRRPRDRGDRKAAAKVRRNPESLDARAARTFRKWHGFEARHVLKVKGPDRRIPATLVALGELPEIIYRSDKWEGRPITYSHKTGQPRPILATDPDGKHLHIVGGNVRVTADGLVG